jgi:gamma-glutamyltranspeptidase / glutathione hydrolase
MEPSPFFSMRSSGRLPPSSAGISSKGAWQRAAAAALLVFAVAQPLNGASREAVRARNGMVVSVDEIASRVGVDILRRGGNAVDAAVAVAFALAVTWPSAGNIGGGGFMMIRLPDGNIEVIDYRERAPLAASRDMYLDEHGNVIPGASTLGYRAVAAPGTVAGMALAHRRHGKLEWKELVEPSRKLAAEGFTVSHFLARSLNHPHNAGRLAKFDESRRIFLKPWREGDRFSQPDLAVTLQRIRDRGADGFYRGRTAQLLIDDIRANGGILTLKDLEEYQPAIRKPLRGSYRGYEIVSMPPPSSGGAVLIQMLNMLERFDVAALGHNSADAITLLAEVQRRAYADRAAFMGDTDFVQVPVAELTSKAYAAARAAAIEVGLATSSSEVKAGAPRPEPAETTHFNVADSSGMVVSNTYTINNSYGSAATAKGTGVLLNNEMDDFTAKPGVHNLYGLVQSEANAIEPRKRPLSSMTPTIILDDGRPYIVLGSPGGGSIINTVLQIIVNVIDHQMKAQAAVDAPRLHHQWLPDTLYWEAGGVNADTRRILEQRGLTFHERSGYPVGTQTIGDGHAILFDLQDGVILGAADPRSGGAAVGY